MSSPNKSNNMLRYRRLLRGWSLQHVADEICALCVSQTGKRPGCNADMVGEWERGVKVPSPYYREKLCLLYGVTADQLDFVNIVSIPVLLPQASSQVPMKEFESLCTDLEFRIQCIIYEALSRRTSLYELQRKLTSVLTLEGSITMDLERRKLLRHLALIPLQAFGLSALGASTERPFAPEDILIHCAAGITACEHLSKGIDLNLAYTATSAYVPTLKSIARNCPLLQKNAAELTTQAMLLLAALGLHLEGSRAAIGYARQAVHFSEISGNLELLLTSLGQLAWIFSCDKQYHKALETAQFAEHLLKHAKDVHPLVESNTYAVLGAYSAQNGHRDEALTALHMATQTFFSTTPANEFSYMDYDYSEIALTWGLVHARTGHPEDALQSFTEIIDPTTLATKMPVSERVRVEFLNHMALASVKSPTKDMERTIKYWQAGIEGAKTLHSEQRLSEAVTAYEIMEGVWPGDRRITNLRELIIHW